MPNKLPGKFTLVVRWNHDGLLELTCDVETVRVLRHVLVERPGRSLVVDTVTEALGRALLARGPEGEGGAQDRDSLATRLGPVPPGPEPEPGPGPG